MGRCRSCDTFPCKNANFIGVIFTLVGSFILFLFQFFIIQKNFNAMFYIIIVLYCLAMWSYFTAVFSEPGCVPVYFGLYSERMGGERKYCLMCHNFKPERSHHCSKCKKCVLNMDHHCPWINNCVGFSNRKYFLLFITYLEVAIILAVITMIIVLISDFSRIFGQHYPFTFNMALRIILFLFYGLLMLVLGHFTVMHYLFATRNTTTLEQLIMQRKKKDKDFIVPPVSNQYDMGCYYNFTQVFGENILLWFLPIEGKGMKGGGVYWDKNGYKANEDTTIQ